MKIKRLCLILLVVAVSLSAAFGVYKIAAPVSASSVEITADDIPSSKLKNSILALPETVSVSFDGENYTATDGIVVRPDGNTVSAGTITLDQTGVYDVKYFFTVGGIKHTAYKKINVHSSYYELQNGSGSSLEKKTLSSGKNGVSVSLTNGATFAYSKAVDLSKVNDKGLSEVIEIDHRAFHLSGQDPVTNKDVYVLDCKEIWVRFTDCYNSNIYAELVLGRFSEYSGGVYSGVRTYCQPVTGLDVGIDRNGSSLDVNIDGVDYSLWPDDVGHMSMGSSYSSNDRTSGYICQYDYAQKRFYLSYTTSAGTATRFVTDLDDPNIQQKSGVLFPGWTTGEVYVTVYGAEYGSGNASFEINSIGGEELYDIIDKNYVDNVKPAITIDAVKTTQTGVYGAVGDSVTIPSASATDVNLVGGVDVAVYRSYGTVAQTSVSVKNGTFKLDRKDLYTVEYTAKDSYGNEGKEVFTYSAIEVEGSTKAIVLDYAQPESLTAGVGVKLDAEVSKNLNGKDVDVQIFVESARQSETFGAQGTLVPLYAENYTVTYVYSDGIYNYETSYTLPCTVDDSVVSFYGDVQLPPYYLKGNYYAIDAAKAYNYVGGAPNEVAVTTYAVFNDDEANKVLVENVNKVLISGNSSVYFLFETAGAEPARSQKVQIIDAATSSGKIDSSKLFVTDDFEKIEGINELKFKTTKTSGNAKMTYFNAISPKFFTFNYKILDNEANFGTLRLTLTDILDSTVKMTLALRTDGKNSYVSINGGDETQLNGYSFTGTSYNSIVYRYAKRMLTIGKSSYFMDSNFPSGSCYFTLEMLDLTGESFIEINKVNNQSLSAVVDRDGMAPEIYVRGFDGDYSVGSIVKTAIPEFNDVLSGIDYSSAKMWITADDQQTVYDKDGNVLARYEGKEVISSLDWTKEYEVKIDRITGIYVHYSVSDFAGKNASVTIALNGIDATAPVITLNNLTEGGTVHIKVCGTVTLNFTVSDNVTSPKYLMTYIHLYCENLGSFVGNITDISNQARERPEDGVYTESFQIHVKGNYEAQIHCYDAQGNHSVTRIAIVVE